MSQAPWLEIFVLCHNRPDSARAAIRSVLAQSTDGFRLTVSDNSSDDRVAQMVQAEFPSVHLLRRGSLPPRQHFNTCIAEACDDYFCLFHDDDLMGPEFVAELRQVVERYPDAVAIGANAWEVNLQTGKRKPCVLGFGRYQQIRTPRELFRRYFGRHQTGFVPFPSYIYRTAVAGQQRIPEGGGKYADVSWLLKLASLGRLVWWHRPLMDYNLHGGNDGMQESRRDRLSFLALLKRHADYAGPHGLGDYRYFIHKMIVAADATKPQRRARVSKLRRFLRWQKLCRHLRLSDLPALIRKMLLKHRSRELK